MLVEIIYSEDLSKILTIKVSKDIADELLKLSQGKDCMDGAQRINDELQGYVQEYGCSIETVERLQ